MGNPVADTRNLSHSENVSMLAKLPNILVTGTPGTGKTSTCALLCTDTGLTHINVGDLVKEKELHDGWDDEYQSYIMNEDKLLDELEERMSQGGAVVDHHSCDFFPERWFDLVVVLQADNSILYDRLASRGYTGKKLQDNVECEIMQVLVEEARDSYRAEIVLVLPSNSVEDMDKNVERVKEWLRLCEQASSAPMS